MERRDHVALALPLADQPPERPERADAARSRRLLLAAAREMVRDHGIDALSMDALAARAGVGVGTVYRRFTDRGGLAFALLDSEERRFQAAFMAGPPPLGPGAPPVARIRAFCHATLERLEATAELEALGESTAPTRRFRVGPYQVRRTHLLVQLAGAGYPGDAEYLADVLLGLLSPGLFLHQHRERGLSLGRLSGNLDRVLDLLLHW